MKGLLEPGQLASLETGGLELKVSEFFLIIEGIQNSA